MSQGKKQTVLLIEAEPSLRRLIALGLQRDDIHVIDVSSPAHIPTLETLDLLIVDIDAGIRSDWSLLTELQKQPLFATIPTVALAWEQPAPQPSTTIATLPTSTMCVTKPFDARILYDTIGQLLAESAAEETSLVAQAEEILLAAYDTHTSYSLMPAITAMGLLIAFIGLMLHIAFTVIGILIVIVTLICWSLSKTKPVEAYFFSPALPAHVQ